jgi:hypothetical protein
VSNVKTRPLPEPLPPETRTIGQLIAETIRLFGDNFWAAIPIGLPLAALYAVTYKHSIAAQTAILWAFGPLVSAAYVWASALVTRTRLTRRRALVAYAVALVVFVPFPILVRLYVLPGLALFAFLGLAVPAAVAEDLGVVAALMRGYRLARVDLLHSVGGIAALALVYGISVGALLVLLHTQSDQAIRVSRFLANLVLAPLVFLGAALLYVDQCARARLAPPDRGGA